jgi:cholesterol transport system auxiliary component
MKIANIENSCRLYCGGLLLVLASGCGALRTTATPPPAFYSLDNTQGVVMDRPLQPAVAGSATLIINPPHAASGFDSRRMVYVRTAQKLEYFAHSEWVDTPARMLAPLLVAATTRSGAFRAVVAAPSSATGELRLDTTIIRLQHEFGNGPSRVRFTLRADLVESASRRVVAWREFDMSIAAASDDPQGGVIAAGKAVNGALEELARFCGEASTAWRSALRAAPGSLHP